jgi:4-amino-4-deoxy-L-arabinose transferase-like glycosyltransferase
VGCAFKQATYELRILSFGQMLISFFERDKTLLSLLWFGIALRVVLYFFISPFGADAHGEIINFIATQHRLPHTREIFCAMHPPLYYLLAQPFYAFDELYNQKVTQILSVILSCLNLYVLYLLVKYYFKNFLTRNVSFLLAIFLHSYITFSLYVTNDSLSFLLGTWCFWLLSRYFQIPSAKGERWLALALGLGLLTKGTFLAFVPIVFGAIALTLIHFKVSWKQLLMRLMISGIIMTAVGGYKFAENWYYEGRPVVHNMDIFPLNDQKTYIGPKSFYGFHLPRLMKSPTIYNGDNKLVHVYPVIMYASFWYKFADLENDFNLGIKTRFKYIGSLIYAVALIPTFLMLLGLGLMTIQSVRFLTRLTTLNTVDFKENIEKATWLGLLLMSIALVLAAGYKYEAWSCFHGRLFLQSFFSLLAALYTGLSYLQPRSKLLFRIGIYGMITLALLSSIYFGVESLYKLIA